MSIIPSPLRSIPTEKGIFSIYFMEEKVGYEEFSWEESEQGYRLTVEGQITKPVQMEIENLTIFMNPSFIPSYFRFKGTISGMQQEITSEITEGRVENIRRVSGEQQTFTEKIKRDAFILPNPVFSPYMAITKKFKCISDPQPALSAYIIPQMETPFSLEPSEENPCLLIMKVGVVEILLETDLEGGLKSIVIPSQKIKAVRDF